MLQTDTTFIRPGTIQPGYGLLSARISLENIGGTNLSAAVFGTNLTDEASPLAGETFYDAPFGFHSVTFGEPRAYGVELSFRFRREGHSVGKACVSTCRIRCARYN